MIVSASRRTDIPSYYSEWFVNRIKEGFVYARNPMNIHQISKIALSTEVVDGIVFWTKNPLPIMDKLHILDRYSAEMIYCKTSTLMSPTANCSRNVNASSVDKLIYVMSAVVYCSTWLWIDSHNGFLSMPRYSNVLPGAFLCK